MAKKFLKCSAVAGSGGVLANVYKEHGTIFAEVLYPHYLQGVLIVADEMYVRLAGFRRIFHAPKSTLQCVRFDRLTRKQRRQHLKIIEGMQELLPGQIAKVRTIFYGKVDHRT